MRAKEESQPLLTRNLWGFNMGWQIWSDIDKDNYGSYGHMGFYCDTKDKSFGPVFLTDSDFSKTTFHELWDKGNFQDPRYDEPQVVYNQTKHIISLMDYEQEIISTLKITRFGDGHAPITLYETSKKDVYENMGFSLFGKEFEYGEIKVKSITEDEFSNLETMLESLNAEVAFMIASEGHKEDCITSASTQNEYIGLGITIEWEVLDKD